MITPSAANTGTIGKKRFVIKKGTGVAADCSGTVGTASNRNKQWVDASKVIWLLRFNWFADASTCS